jgi:peptidyl-prolyl cis-trans isomerase C
MRPFSIAALLAATSLAAPAALAQPAAKGAAQSDPVVATVNGQAIHMSDVTAAMSALPPEARQLPPDQLYPKLLDRMVNSRALIQEAKKMGLDKDPAVQKQMQAAEDNVLQGALLQKEVLPKVTEEAIKAKYDQQIAGKPGEQEVHARHILVPTEEQAKQIIAQLDKGAKFEDLAKKYSTDPAKENGGDLGYFKKDDMLPEFSAAAFALQPGSYTKTPVHTRYGWHVIQVLDKRTAQPPTFDQVHDEIRQELIQENIAKVVQQARAGARVQEFNPDGTPLKTAQAGQNGAPGAAKSK